MIPERLAYACVLTHVDESAVMSAEPRRVLVWIDWEDAESFTCRRVRPSALSPDVAPRERFPKTEWKREG